VDKLTKQIASKLKSLRSARGWSLDKTALETGVSKAMLGQIERNESSPTIATLWKIASGFQTSFSSFLEDTHLAKQKTMHRIGEAHNFNDINDKFRVTTLFPFDKESHCEIFAIELLPHCEHLSLPHKPGVIEHVIVVDGTMDVLLDDIWQTLRKGEGVRFSANQAHGYRNTTAKNACFHNIIHYPGNV
jgi:transcriptional regulator with XRE-family HTH domain